MILSVLSSGAVINETFSEFRLIFFRQLHIMKDVREVLGVTSGDRISFIVENGTVHIVNSAVYAMQMLQSEMAGEAERTGLTSDDDVMELVKELRNEDENI